MLKVIAILGDVNGLAPLLAEELEEVFPDFKFYCYKRIPDLFLDIHSRMPCLIITDIKSRGMDGCELLRALRAKPAHDQIPVLVLIDYPIEFNKEYAARLLKIGFAGVLEKPYDIDAVCAAIKKLLNMKKTILVLDDVNIYGELLQIEFQDMGYETHSLQLKLPGYHWTVANHPALIITDILSPDMDGLTFLKLIRATDETKDIPVIIVSGAADKNREQALALGASGVIQKPYDLFEIRKTVKRILDPNVEPLQSRAKANKRIIIAAKFIGWGPSFAVDLKKHGYDVTVVESFDTMQDYLTRIRYDLVIPTNDDTLKGDHLPERITELRLKYPKLAIVVMSDCADMKIAIDYLKRGVDDSISVPFGSENAIETIDRVLQSKSAST